jgi:hypothetical protein
MMEACISQHVWSMLEIVNPMDNENLKPGA